MEYTHRIINISRSHSIIFGIHQDLLFRNVAENRSRCIGISAKYGTLEFLQILNSEGMERNTKAKLRKVVVRRMRGIRQNFIGKFLTYW